MARGSRAVARPTAGGCEGSLLGDVELQRQLVSTSAPDAHAVSGRSLPPEQRHGVPAALVMIAWYARWGMRARSSIVAFALMSAAAITVHATSTIEAHLLVFIAVPIVALYEDRAPFATSIGTVVGHPSSSGSATRATSTTTKRPSRHRYGGRCYTATVPVPMHQLPCSCPTSTASSQSTTHSGTRPAIGFSSSSPPASELRSDQATP